MNLMSALTCFKVYDVRGRVPEELNSDISYRLGAAYAKLFALGQLSQETHHHRAEQWVVFSGTARVTGGDASFFAENDSNNIRLVRGTAWRTSVRFR